jgi:hypothetical protein
MGLIVGLEHDGMRQGVVERQAAIRQPARFCYLEVARDQGVGKTPRALALVTACVRLCTQSLP